MSDTALIMEEENQFKEYHEHLIRILNETKKFPNFSIRTKKM